MIKKLLPIALLGLTVLGNSSCTNSGFKKQNGVEYKIVKDVPGRNAAIGDILEMNIRMKIGDSVLIDSRNVNNNKPVQIQLAAPVFAGDWMSALSRLSQGDSAVIRVAVDTLKKSVKQQLPPFMKPGKMLVYEVSMVSIKSAADYKKEAMTKSAGQMQADDKTLQDYFAKNNIHPQKTASGLYYTIQKDGTGEPIHNGQTVTMHYVGKTLDGHVFDSNTDTSKNRPPFTFPVGQQRVIPGMDEGVMLLKKDSKATLYIPSPLAYGSAAPGPGVGPNSILMFDVEVTDVK